jgi:hypothetical protein
MRATIISAIYDHYDSLKPVCPQVGVDVDWVCVTDTELPQGSPEGWEIIHLPKPELHPNHAAKAPKFCPWNFTKPGVGASVWIDASYRVTSPTFVVDVLALADPIAQFIHPWRDCLYDEAVASAALPKYAGLPVMNQADAYRKAGHPEHWGLWATGVIARHHTEEVKKLGWVWSFEVAMWTYQDQISQPHLLRSTGLRPVSLPGDHITNPWLRYEGSARH